jgi:hypothetical protein
VKIMNKKTVIAMLMALMLLLLFIINSNSYSFAFSWEPPTPKPPKNQSKVIRCNMTEVTPDVSFSTEPPAPKPPEDLSKVIRCNMTEIKAAPEDPFVKVLPPKSRCPNSAEKVDQPTILQEDHHSWGTEIYQTNWPQGYPRYELMGVFAKQYVRGDLDLGGGGSLDRTLYAPTLKSPIPCPLEAVMWYYRPISAQTTTIGFNVWDFITGYWGMPESILLADLRAQGFTYGSGSNEYYYVTVYWDEWSQIWGVYLYNFNLGYWMEEYETGGGSAITFYGWNAYEVFGWDGN